MGKNRRFTNTDVKGLKGKNTHALGDKLYVRERDGHKTFVLIYRPKFGPRRGKKDRADIWFDPA